MGFNPPVPQRDSSWEIRVAVLLSLAFQVVLSVAGPLRKRSSSRFLRLVIWSCYILADWVADLALGLLLNSIGGGGAVSTSDDIVIPSTAGLKHAPHGATSEGFGGAGGGGGGSSPVIFAFWAPFLLLHLGGPDSITAYSLADNELWRRHLISLMFELSAAAAVFLSSLRGNPMVTPTVLMFVAGIIKYGERTYSLYMGSADGFTKSILGNGKPGNFPGLMEAYQSRENAGFKVGFVTNSESEVLYGVYDRQGEALSRVEYDGADEVRAYDLFSQFRPLLVNGVISTRTRRVSEAFYQVHGDRDRMEAFHIAELELGFTYDMLYTKMPVFTTASWAGYALRFVACGCVVSSLAIFQAQDKAGLLPVDAGVTYALLVAAVALEAAALVMLLLSDWTLVFFVVHQQSVRLRWLSRLVSSINKAKRSWRPWTWTGRVRRMSFIDHSISTRTPGFRRAFLPAPFANNNAAASEPLGHTNKDLLVLIFERIRDTVAIATTPKDRKMACEARGERAVLRELKGCINPDRQIKSTLIFKSVSERDFDESLLLWHVATDLCLNADDRPAAPTLATFKMRAVSRCLSEYMLYLLLNKPEMLSATMGIGHLRYRNAYAHANRLYDRYERLYGDDSIIDHSSACRTVLSTMSTRKFEDGFVQGDRTQTVLFNACVLAKALMSSIADPEAMWKVVAHVWVEMLTFSAARAPPREHLRELRHGAELITVVWILMAHMGMSSTMFEVQETEPLHRIIIIGQ
ncbi:unnamed protein product [Urochloa decumbens]|uniref:DUF4220 domain-containing protein n=1 Tax=Urochloa decumbens TaxID=240449 RepID=A0ABC8XCJ2_9POAL